MAAIVVLVEGLAVVVFSLGFAVAGHTVIRMDLAAPSLVADTTLELIPWQMD